MAFETEETTNEMVVVEQVNDQPATLPDYAILNPEIPNEQKRFEDFNLWRCKNGN